MKSQLSHDAIKADDYEYEFREWHFYISCETMAKIQKKIKSAIYGLIDKTAHLDVADATQYVAKKLGLKDRMVNYAHIEIRNTLNEEKYKSTPYKERILFLPQCLRNSSKCVAVLEDEGWKCKKCGKCKVCELKALADSLGYMGTFIAPGGSMVHKLISKYHPKAVLGVGCYDEILMAMDALAGSGIAVQGVMLDVAGCKDTIVNMDEALDKIRLIELNGKP
jgi:hypothetical protein